MNEIDKMRNSQLADMEKPEIQASFIHAKKLVAQLRMMSTYDDGFREVLEELVPGIEMVLRLPSQGCAALYQEPLPLLRCSEHRREEAVVEEKITKKDCRGQSFFVTQFMVPALSNICST